MPVRVEKISVDFGPYSDPVNIVTRKCYRCKSRTLTVSSVAIALASILITMLNTLRLVLNA